ncbi:MAG: leucine-rich repeat protein, partial [Kiritimatiellae bacterium]|nr:leucine-rich repeat protein [Kiritimatiellia bacterium]
MTDNRRNLFVQGDKFGDYTVVRMLGKGGMGAVYLMRGTSGTEYAVKIMYPDKVTHEMRRRFAYEAEFAIKIRHRNLVSVYDVGEDPETGLCYMIMDYVPGGSLSDLVKRRGRLPLEEAVPIFEQVAKALEVAHRNKLVHRDVKPDNILFDADGTPRLADLGVAKFEDAHKSAVTTTGMIIGTPAYMAPEQMLNSHDIDGRADIYALGVVLYEMLSGKRVNEGRTAIELMARALKGETLPDIRSLCPELSETMAHLVSRLCAPEPEGRPQTALEAAELLRKAASGKLVLVKKESPEAAAARKTALRARRRKQAKVAAAAAGAAAFLLFGIAGWVKALKGPKGNLPIVVVTNIVVQTKDVANVAVDKPGNPKTAFVIPALDRSPTAWVYSFEGGHGWEKPDFDDSKWNRAPGGFGMRNQPLALPNARINTPWTTRNLYVRRHFMWSGGDVSRAVLDLFHDDGARIYLNGYLVLEVNGYNFSWEPFEIPLEKFNNALRNGDNVFCVEICNDLGNGYFDCGLVVESGGVSVPHAGPDMVHKIKTDVGTWTVVVRDGIAQIGLGKEHVALEPRPKGHLKIPSELGGFAIQRLAQDCFMECKELESVEIPEGVRSVGEGAFALCGRLSNIVLPSSLEYIGRMAFGATVINGIDLKNVHLLDDCAFGWRSSNFSTVKVNSDNPRFYVKDGVLYDGIRRAVVFCPPARETYVFPDGIEEIYDCAFERSSLRQVVVPATIKHVGQYAFNGCPYLESVKFMGDNATIRFLAFGNTPSLKTVVLPKRLKSLGESAVFAYSGLESVVLPDTLEVIGDKVFEDCRKLKRITLGKSLRQVGHRAFIGCRELKHIEFPATLDEMGAEVFRDCVSLKTVTFNGTTPKLFDQDAKTLARNMYHGANSSLATLVPYGSTGGSGKLPEVWPVNGGENARAIHYFRRGESPQSTNSMARRQTVDKPVDPKTAFVIPALDRSPTAWAYSFEGGHGWEKPDFDDSKWKRAPGGFGMRDQSLALPNARINTPWTTKKLYVRRHFTWSGGDVSRAVLDLFHDDGARIYLNGYLVLEVNGYNFSWEPFE